MQRRNPKSRLPQSPLMQNAVGRGVVLDMRRRTSDSKRYGLTFTEVVVSIAIIAVVSLITFGVMMKAKDSSKDAVVFSNLKQIGNSHLLYSQDFDDGMPNLVPVNGGKPVNAEPGKPFDPKKPGSIVKYTEDPIGWKSLLQNYGASSDMFFSPADPFARTDKVLYGTVGPTTSKDTSITYPSGTITPIAVEDGRVYWTLTQAEESNRNESRPLLITNVYHPQNSKKALTVHRLSRKVPSWYLEGNVRSVDLRTASPIHD